MVNETIAIATKNMEALLKYNGSVLGDLDGVKIDEFQGITKVFSENGEMNAKIIENGKEYYLHSIVNPRKDSEKLIGSLDFERDSLIVVFGIGCAHHLRVIKEKINQNTRVIIVEHNIDMLKFALSNIDLSDIFQSPQFLLIYGDEQMQEKQLFVQTGFNFYSMSYNIQYAMLPNYYIYQEQNLKVMANIRKRFKTEISFLGNSLEDVFNGFKNNYYNIEAAVKSNSAKEIKDKFTNIPAIVVASGPSLDKNIHLLKQAQGKAVIIACDASLEACKKQGVVPDMVASIERDEPTYTYYYENKEIDENIVLVGPGLLWPKIYDEYKGKHIMLSKFDKTLGIEGWWHSHFENVEYINQGMSSATVAFSMAEECGCNPIILIGQDLAYSEGKIHSELTHHGDEGDNDARSTDGVYVKDYEGNDILSHEIYVLFKNWFEFEIVRNKDRQVIDATEGGAYIKGSTVLKFEEAIQQYCKTEKAQRVVDCLENREVTQADIKNKVDEIIIDIEKEFAKLKKLESMANEHFNRLGKMKNSLKKRQDDIYYMKMINKLQKGDKIIKWINNNNSISTFYKAIIAHTIMHVKKIGNQLTYDNVLQNIYLQTNLMYIIKESTDYVRKEYTEMEEYLKAKREELEGAMKS